MCEFTEKGKVIPEKNIGIGWASNMGLLDINVQLCVICCDHVGHVFVLLSQELRLKV